MTNQVATNPISARPAQAVLGLAARAIFATDPPVVAEAVERGEDRGIVHLALVRLLARRHRRDLHVANEGQMLLEPADQIAADDPDAKKKKSQLCQANFYSGEWALRMGAKDEAVRLFRLAASGCAKDVDESFAANAQLKALGAAP